MYNNKKIKHFFILQITLFMLFMQVFKLALIFHLRYHSTNHLILKELHKIFEKQKK